MKRFILSTVLATSVMAATVAETQVTRASIQRVEKNFNERIQTSDIKSPLQLLGVTRGIYLPGTGVVFSTEVNLMLTTNTSPFQQTIPKEYAVRVHTGKLERLRALKQTMRDMLVNSASMLDAVPAGEQIVLGVTLFYYAWEDTSGLPAQVVMQAPRQKLLDLKQGKVSKSELESAIKVQEF
jgi:hypothetical protein